MFIASLPWYDFPSSRSHLDSVYRLIQQQLARKGVDGKLLPEQLDRQTLLQEQWSNKSLILSQCCGPDLCSPAGRALKVIARPVFNTLDCQPGYYFSHIVTRSKNLSDTPNIVVNSNTSYSGCTALLNWLKKTGRSYKHYQVSNSHQGSINRLLSGEADVAAIDAYSWQFIEHDGLQIIDRSETALAPPFVCHNECDIDHRTLASALELSFREKGAPLHLTKIASADNQLYQDSYRLKDKESE